MSELVDTSLIAVRANLHFGIIVNLLGPAPPVYHALPFFFFPFLLEEQSRLSGVHEESGRDLLYVLDGNLIPPAQLRKDGGGCEQLKCISVPGVGTVKGQHSKRFPSVVQY